MSSEYILSMNDITKEFTGVKALEDVSLQVRKGEVHALMGENGAGKSTLMKCLMGIHQDYKGEIQVDGETVRIQSPIDALSLGISMIHQELNPIPEMTIAENIYLGREMLLAKTPFINKKIAQNNAKKLLEKFELKLDPKAKMSSLSVAQKQMIEIIKAVSYNSRIIIMDEPTSALASDEVKVLFRSIKQLRKEGVAIIYISHRMDEIYELSDRITILRDGKFIATKDMKGLEPAGIIKMMVGRELTELFPKVPAKIGNIVFEVKNLKNGNVFSNINFYVKKGEILGVAGLVGAGRSEIMKAIFGIDSLDQGEIYIDGKQIEVNHPEDAIKQGLALVTEDRKDLGLVLCRSIKENIALTNLNKLTNGPFINLKQEKQNIEEKAKEFSIKMTNIDQKVKNLSGGNQQKVVLAKWLYNKPKVLILDEPTRGIDVGAKAEIHRMMSQFANEGLSVIMISSEMPEIMGMSDRVIVVSKGEITGEFDLNNTDVTQEQILSCALGGSKGE